MKADNGLVFLLITVNTVMAEIHFCPDCEYETVEKKTMFASNGDTIILPEDTCKWTKTLTITNGKMVLLGRGIDKTTIIDSTPVGWESPLMVVRPSAKDTLRIGGINFHYIAKESSSSSEGVININGECRFRIDHCSFSVSGGDYRTCSIVIKNAFAWGIIDKCHFHNGKVNVEGSEKSWIIPRSPGSDSAVYIENCRFIIDGSEDAKTNFMNASQGGKYVYRNCFTDNGWIQVHGACQCNGRAGTWVEAYNNLFQCNENLFCFMAFFGGSGTIWNNTATGNYNQIGILIGEHRGSHELYNNGVCKERGFGYCDGTNPIDGNEIESASRHRGDDGSDTLVLDMPSMTDSQYINCTLFNITDGSSGRIISYKNHKMYAELKGGKINKWNKNDSFTVSCGWPCFDQIGRGKDRGKGTKQETLPMYEWKNTINKNPVHFKTASGLNGKLQANYLKEKRDFYNDTKMTNYTPYTFPHLLAKDIWYSDSTLEISSNSFKVGYRIFKDTGCIYLQIRSEKGSWALKDSAFGSSRKNSRGTLGASKLIAGTYFVRLIYSGRGYASGIRDTIDADGSQNGWQGWQVVLENPDKD